MIMIGRMIGFYGWCISILSVVGLGWSGLVGCVVNVVVNRLVEMMRESLLELSSSLRRLCDRGGGRRRIFRFLGLSCWIV